MMKITFDQRITQKFNEAIRREWLESNGLGGWASSTISGAHTLRSNLPLEQLYQYSAFYPFGVLVLATVILAGQKRQSWTEPAEWSWAGHARIKKM